MGNDQKMINYYIKPEDIKEVINDKKSNILHEFYNQYSSGKYYLNKQDFSKLIKISDQQILDEIFDIFCGRKDYISFNGLKRFYTSFKNPKLKYILLSFIFFGKNKKLTKLDYVNKIINYIRIDMLFGVFINEKFIENIRIKEKPNQKEIYLYKNLFIEKANEFFEKDFSNFNFIEEIPSSSKFIESKFIDIKPFNYICDCLSEKIDTNVKDLDELEQMRIPFNNDKPAVIDGHLNLKAFEKIMLEFRVNQKLINLVIQFLKSYTMRDYMNFEDFKYLMSNIYYPVSISDKRMFLFKMILTICNEENSIEVSKLYKILQIENKDNIKSKKIDLDSIEDTPIEIEIDYLLGYIDTLGLLPYLRYGIKPNELKLKKYIINYYLNNK